VIYLHAITAAASWMLVRFLDGFPALLAQFSRAASPAAPLASTVINAIWQGAAVAIALALALRFSRVSASHRFVAWTAGFALVAVLPFLPLAVRAVSAATALAASSPVALAHHRPLLQLDPRWAFIIAALWLVAALVRAVELIFHSIRLRKLWKSASPIAPAALVAPLAGSDHTRRSIEICTTPHLDRPSVIGFFQPRILIPEWLLPRLAPQELDQVVLHEAEHIRRRDDWTNLAQKLALVLFPLNPALAWIERQLCREREMACDEGVVRKTHAPRAYAACLASLAERSLDYDLARRAAALSLAAWRRRPELVHRVRSILLRKQTLHPFAARAVVSAVACGLLLAAIELARCPQFVAFVPAPPQTPAQATSPSPIRVSYSPLASSSFRAVETRAVLASARAAATNPPLSSNRAAQLSPRASSHSSISAGDLLVSSREPASASPREFLLKAEQPSLPAASAARRNSLRQPIVFAAWEQVLTLPHNGRLIADYEIAVASDPTAAIPDDAGLAAFDNSTNCGPSALSQANAAATRPSTHCAPQDAAPQIVITRIILIYPATGVTAVPNSANPATADPAAAPDSNPVPPAAALTNGWLVLQL